MLINKLGKVVLICATFISMNNCNKDLPIITGGCENAPARGVVTITGVEDMATQGTCGRQIIKFKFVETDERQIMSANSLVDGIEHIYGDFPTAWITSKGIKAGMKFTASYVSPSAASACSFAGFSIPAFSSAPKQCGKGMTSGLNSGNNQEVANQSLYNAPNKKSTSSLSTQRKATPAKAQVKQGNTTARKW